jgi:divalent metal cation (Fe/Co/Zn/Cd) transporter
VHRMGWRVVVPASLGVLAAVAAVAALVAREWIENLLSWSPDGGSGELELALPAVLLVASLISAILARWQWRKRRAASVGD